MHKVSEKPLLALIEVGGVNDRPVVVPAATPLHATFIEAIKMLKAAGYRVSKPRKPKVFKRGKNRVGPTFVAEFADGTTVRMTTHSAPEKLDWERGERLARHAWAARHKIPSDRNSAELSKLAPPINICRFERDGVVLAQRGSAA